MAFTDKNIISVSPVPYDAKSEIQDTIELFETKKQKAKPEDEAQ